MDNQLSFLIRKIKVITAPIWKRRILRVPLKILGFIAIIYIGYPYILYSQDERYFERQFQSAVKARKDEIFIRDLTDFEWDMVCPETAYGDGNKYKVIEGYKVQEGVDIPIFYNDGIYGLMFVKDKEIFKFLKPINPNFIGNQYTRKLPPKYLSSCMSNVEARFIVISDEDKKSNSYKRSYILTFLNKGESYLRTPSGDPTISVSPRN